MDTGRIHETVSVLKEKQIPLQVYLIDLKRVRMSENEKVKDYGKQTTL